MLTLRRVSKAHRTIPVLVSLALASGLAWAQSNVGELSGQVSEPTDEPLRRIILMPGGAVPGVGIQLLGKRGARRIVRLDPMTGYPRVEGVRPS